MTRPVLHHCVQSRSMRSLWLLYELGIAFDLVTHGFDKSLRDPAYLAVSPAGRVPSLEIDGRTLFETGAIAEYLCERFSPDALGRRPGHAERADWLIWVHFAETISQHAAALTQQHIVLRDDATRSPIVMKLEAARLGKCYAAIEARLKHAGDWLLQGGFSAADIGVGQAIYIARYFHRLEGFAHLQAWYARLAQRDAFQNSLPSPDDPGLIYRKAFYPAWDMPAA